MTEYATSSIPKAIDALLLCFRTILNPSIAVYDGLPTDLPDLFVTVGGAVMSTASGKEQWASLGNSAKTESYNVQCYIEAYAGGAQSTGDPTLNDNAQKTVRDNAFAAYHSIANALLADKALVAYGAPFGAAGYVTAVDLTGTQTSASDVESGKGRKFTLEFGVEIQNYLGVI